jgi:multiple sugar transport system permease protein
VITEGGPGRATEVANIFAYKLGFAFFDMGKASAVAWLLLLIAVAFSGLYLRVLRGHTATI